MSKSDWLIRVCVWLALLGYLPGAAYALVGRYNPSWDKAVRWIWTLSCACLLLHIAFALHFVHRWNQTSVYVETARQTAEVFGVNWGGGMYVNYALLTLWLVDLVWWWVWPQSYTNRPRWLTVSWHAFLLFIFFNATVVFVNGTLRWLGVAGTVVLLWIFFRNQTEERIRNRRK